MMTPDSEAAWESDPEVVVFVGEEEDLAVGAAEQHGLGQAIGRAFGRSREAVTADLAKTFDQMHSLLDGLPEGTHGYEASQISFQLAFTAKGQVAFVAEASMTTSISVTFDRKGRRGT
jgi:hypothetical protein